MLELFQYEHEVQHRHNVKVSEDLLGQFSLQQYFRQVMLLSRPLLHYALVPKNNLDYAKFAVFALGFFLKNWAGRLFLPEYSVHF
ncbi:TPA: hypothetical protein J1W17_003272 [Escherichia coli]|jgi:hypothetical protein|nr:hypothetical protein [Escherichia coli]